MNQVESKAQIKKIQNGISPLSYHASMQPLLFCTLACLRWSDRGDGAKRCEKKTKQRGGRVGGESEVSFLFPSPLFLLIFLPLSYLVLHFTIGTPGTGYPIAEWVKSQYMCAQSTPIIRSYTTCTLSYHAFNPVSFHSKSKLWRQYHFRMVD